MNKIGETHGGGIVFWVDASGQHGLVAATADQSEGIQWCYVAQICANYQGGGYVDWYLPSKYELNLLYQQKRVVGGFADAAYWSSTEHNADYAWAQYFGDDVQSHDINYASGKGSPNRVRAVQTF